MADVTIVGGGLAGVECAFQIVRGGFSVLLLDRKPDLYGAYEMPGFAELVCSNSLKSDVLTTASGLLKAEMRMLGSVLLKTADAVRLRAGGALAVDRTAFSARITAALEQQPQIEIRHTHVTEIPGGSPFTVIATGPLTDDLLAGALDHEALHFFDATAPIVDVDSIRREHLFEAGRYDKGGADYLNCILDEDVYDRFLNALLSADTVPLSAYDGKVFAHCQPLEHIAASGRDTLRYGPFRPTGLRDPKSGKRPFAVLQLRREDRDGRMWGLVGCQTRLTFPEQRRIFRLIPALQTAEFHRYGVMHRNTYVNGPRVLTWGNEMKDRPGVFVAGQLSGVEGYMESAASGLLTGRFIRQLLEGRSKAEAVRLLPPGITMLGALHRYVIESPSVDFQPMNANFGLFAASPDEPAKKWQRREYYGTRSAAAMAALSTGEHG